MKRPLSIAALLFALCAFPASAILDTNSNGLSDLWETMYNDGDLFSSTDFPYSLQDDMDGDGWTNAQEAAAGTNPFDPNPPDGLIRPDIVHTPAVWIDTDFDEIPDTISTPGAITITWPTIAGKQYTLLSSPGLTEWLSVEDWTFIGSGNLVDYGIVLPENDKLFWRVAIKDVDSDGDGLTDAEEAALGTDPNNAETIDGIPDLWLATYFTNVLLAEGPNAIDPNAILNSDGYTIAQKAFLNLDPNTSNTPITGPIGQETIVNGYFSQPEIGSAPSNTSDPTWDYWGEGGVPGWTAVVGHNIELQNVETTGTNGQYCELKAEPEDHYGINQQVGTRKRGTYLLALDCKARQNTTLANNEFSVKIDGAAVQSIAPASTWSSRYIPFTATKVLTDISLVPLNSLDDKKGCFVDNVKLMPIDIVPDDNMAGLVGDVVEPVNPSSKIKHFVSPKQTTELPQDYVILKASGITAEQITDGHANQIVEWDGGEAVTNEPLLRRVKRDAASKSEVKIKVKQSGMVAVQMQVWIVWSDVTTTNGVASFANFMGGATYEVSTQPTEGWRFVFKIQPASILDQATPERPRLSGNARKGPPGIGKPYTIKPTFGDGDSATKQWDVSRQYKVTIRNPGGIPKADLQQGNVADAWIANQPVAVDTPVSFPLSDVEGNDDPLKLDAIDEDVNPYAAYNATPKLNHQFGELSSYDAPLNRVLDVWGAANRAYSVEMNFNEFARVELWDGKRDSGQFWFRISGHIKWHHYLDTTYDSSASEWKDAASSSGIGHPKP